jgi:hypothetical protein
MSNDIHIIPWHQVDKTRWDNCIASSHNGLIYATSIYLDAMATQWDAVILNNYEFVMPLPWRKKYFIFYVYPPAFVQQLGIFSPNIITAKQVALFIDAIPKKFKFCSMHFNYANKLTAGKTTTRKNYLLDLAPEYNVLYKAYSRSAVRNITKANNAGVRIVEDVAAASIIQMHRKRFNDVIGATAADYKKFSILCEELTGSGQCFTAGAYNNSNTLIAGSVYFKHKNRLTFILNGNTRESLTCGATHLLKDYTIKKFANQGMILDFEGSDFENFARFYEQFGAKEVEHYTTLTINRLPPFLRLLKR